MQRSFSKIERGEWKEDIVVEEHEQHFCTHCGMSGC